MNRQRLRYIFFSLLSLTIAFFMAYGISDVGDPLFGELAVLVSLTVILSYLVGRDSDNTDETAGIVSMDDDD